MRTHDDRVALMHNHAEEAEALLAQATWGEVLSVKERRALVVRAGVHATLAIYWQESLR